MKRFIYIFTSLLLLASCHDEDAPRFSDKTMVIYMAADNNLSAIAYENINKMESALPNNNFNLIVYLDPKDDVPKILRIQKDNSNEIKSEVIKTYAEHNSASPQVMHEVLTTIQEKYPSEHAGLILWSHSTAWLPPAIRTRSFGEDNGSQIDIKDLPNAIPDGFEYIIFDSCLMGNVESAYEIKEKTAYILASPTETLAEGLPYAKVTPLFFSDAGVEERLKAIGKTFFNYYNEELYQKMLDNAGDDATQKEIAEGYRTATTTLIKTSELRELARQTGIIVRRYPLTLWDYHYQDIQKLDTAIDPYTKLYDFYDFLEVNYGASVLEDVKVQLRKTILYKEHTEYFIKNDPKGDYKIERYCGLSCYVPTPQLPQLNTYYRSLKWTNASGFSFLLK